jgi:hypothetical protein
MPDWWPLAAAFLAGAVLGWMLRGGSGEPRVTVLPPTSPAELDSQVRALVSVGKKIQAIKLYREFHHVDLKDAKNIVDAIELGLPSGQLR